MCQLNASQGTHVCAGKMLHCFPTRLQVGASVLNTVLSQVDLAIRPTEKVVSGSRLVQGACVYPYACLHCCSSSELEKGEGNTVEEECGEEERAELDQRLTNHWERGTKFGTQAQGQEVLLLLQFSFLKNQKLLFAACFIQRVLYPSKF